VLRVVPHDGTRTHSKVTLRIEGHSAPPNECSGSALWVVLGPARVPPVVDMARPSATRAWYGAYRPTRVPLVG
jgi:hypothetical protein